MNNTNKRKRGNEDMGRNIKTTNPTDENTAYSLLQGMENTLSDESARTAQAALAGDMGDNSYPAPDFDTTTGLPNFSGNSPGQGMSGPQSTSMYSTPNQAPNKPVVGSSDWQNARKHNHKEVERRRREVINDGINVIAKIVPGTEKNKGAILQRTAQYIKELQASVAKFETERATLDVALKELTSRNDRLKDSLQQAWKDSKKWQRRCRDAGLQFDDYDIDSMGTDNVGDTDLDAAFANS